MNTDFKKRIDWNTGKRHLYAFQKKISNGGEKKKDDGKSIDKNVIQYINL